jgi:hypothetical protein
MAKNPCFNCSHGKVSCGHCGGSGKIRIGSNYTSCMMCIYGKTNCMLCGGKGYTGT